MLAGTASTSSPSSRSVWTAASSLSGRLADTVGVYPSCPSARAMAWPMPLEPPVTSAERPAMSSSCVGGRTCSCPWFLSERASRGRCRSLGVARHRLQHVVGTGHPRWPLLAPARAAALPGCGGGGPSSHDRPPAVPAAQGFPDPDGRTLRELRGTLGPGPRLATSGSVLEPGRNRVAFALFDRARRQIGDTPTALYTARADGTDLRGPFMASYLTLETAPRFRSRTTTGDADSAHSIYVA